MKILYRIGITFLLGMSCFLVTEDVIALTNASVDSTAPQEAVLMVQKDKGLTYDHALIGDGFRIFYTLDGSEASPEDLTDSNADEIPDFIENIREKLRIAKKIITQELQLHDPLTAGRLYDKGAKYIDIYFAEIPEQYGIASGILVKEPIILAGTPYAGNAIKITMHRGLGKNTATPIHELFHLFQYSYSEFYNRWYTEGLARWSESLVKKSHNYQELLPSNAEETNALLLRSHDAGAFWYRLVSLCKPIKSPMETTIQLESLETVENKLIKALLEAIEKHYLAIKVKNVNQTDTAADWPKAQSRAVANNQQILQAIREAVLSSCSDADAELSNFIRQLP